MKRLFADLLKIRLLLILPLVIAFTACDQDKFFDESLSLAGDQWPKDEALSFAINIDDTVSPYRFFINVRNSTS